VSTVTGILAGAAAVGIGEWGSLRGRYRGCGAMVQKGGVS
jgi:hypothetical protein